MNLDELRQRVAFLHRLLSDPTPDQSTHRLASSCLSDLVRYLKDEGDIEYLLPGIGRCNIHDTWPSGDEPCWGCVNPYEVKLEKAKEALRFYADPASWNVWSKESGWTNKVKDDKGSIAKRALDELKEEQ